MHGHRYYAEASGTVGVGNVKWGFWGSKRAAHGKATSTLHGKTTPNPTHKGLGF